MTTESSSPTAGGFFAPALTSEPISCMTRRLSLCKLPGGQPCESIVLQRFLLVILPVLSTMDLKGGAVATSRLFCRSQETFTLACGMWKTFSGPACWSSGLKIH